MNFDREAARQAGYTEEEIDAYLRQQQRQPVAPVAPSDSEPTRRQPAVTEPVAPGSFDREAAKKAGYTDEEIDAYLAGEQDAMQNRAPGSVAGAIAPAVTGYAYSQPTGLKPIVDDVGRVAGQGLKAVAARGLATNLADVAGVASHGVPWGSVARGAVNVAAANPAQTAETVARAGEMLRAAPAYAGQVGGAMLRGAARVAGPAGMAYNLYEAAPYIQQGGQELASGAAQNRMREARQAVLNAPTPAPLTRQEAENLYSSGDQRLINIYKNDAELSALIRRRAAARVLPVAP